MLQDVASTVAGDRAGSPLPKAIHGRPRGFITWQPQARTQQLIESVQAILSEYQAHLPLTIRQIFYRQAVKDEEWERQELARRLAGWLKEGAQ